MKNIKAYVVIQKDPLILRYITFHKSKAEEKLEKTDRIVECVVSIPLPDDKKIENVLKK